MGGIAVDTTARGNCTVRSFTVWPNKVMELMRRESIDLDIIIDTKFEVMRGSTVSCPRAAHR